MGDAVLISFRTVSKIILESSWDPFIHVGNRHSYEWMSVQFQLSSGELILGSLICFMRPVTQQLCFNTYKLQALQWLSLKNPSTSLSQMLLVQEVPIISPYSRRASRSMEVLLEKGIPCTCMEENPLTALTSCNPQWSRCLLTAVNI